jgi:predicted TIM-barrel fold metal-dependent hydrolase
MTAPTQQRLISADSHVLVRPDDVKARLPQRVIPQYEDALAVQGAAASAQRAGQVLTLDDFDMEGSRSPGYFDASARLHDMDRDGVDVEVLYSELSSFRHFHLVGDEWRVVARAFNDHLAEFAAVDPKRLVVSYQLPIIDIDHAVSEVQRLAGLGARSVQLPNYPSELGFADYHDSRYDPLWSALEETSISISQHLGPKDSLWDVFRRDPLPQKGIFTSLPAMALAENLAWWILTGVLERHPGLQIVFVEPGLGWVPYYLDILDSRVGRYDMPEITEKPSEYFRRNMSLTFMDDPRGVAMRHELGVENIMWSTDFPHPATTWPNSQEFIARNFAGVPDDEMQLMVCGNAARVYGL